jgi:hypothetical protein
MIVGMPFLTPCLTTSQVCRGPVLPFKRLRDHSTPLTLVRASRDEEDTFSIIIVELFNIVPEL